MGRIIPGVYDSTIGVHPHHLAVLFAVTALALRFSTDQSRHDWLNVRSIPALTFHETSYACLVAGNFYTDISVACLIALHLVGAFLLNSGDIKSPNAIFGIIGAAVRLAVIAGYHRGL